MQSAKTILYVCTGNTCRSYMAEVLARTYLLQSHPQQLQVSILSAGTGAVAGECPSPEAQKVMLEQKATLKEHYAQCITPELIREADLILVMTRSHQRSVLQLVPEAMDKVHLLKEYSSRANPKQNSPTEKPDIADPFGQSLEEYRRCAEQLREYVYGAMERFLSSKE